MAKKHRLEDASEPDTAKKSRMTNVSSKPMDTEDLSSESYTTMDTKCTSEPLPKQALQGPQETEGNPILNDLSQSKQSPAQDSSEASKMKNTIPEDATIGDGEVTGANILPPQLVHLTKKYSFATMTIRGHSKINNKVRAMVAHMSRFDYMDPKLNPGVIVLDARASDANKLITVIEIAKKDIFENNRSGKWYQYNRASSEMTQIPRRPSKKSRDVPSNPLPVHQEDETELDEIEGENTTNKKQIPKDVISRAIPVLTIYMSRVPIPELRQIFGEQNNENDIAKWWEPLPLAVRN